MDLSVVAWGRVIDDHGTTYQFIGKAKTTLDVSLIHDQAAAWKNGTLDRDLDAQIPIENKFSDIYGLNNSGEKDDIITLLESTYAAANLPYGEVLVVTDN
ncbi:MAG: hypothetical protein METHP_00755 [Methanoregula sp. SKADARSKE-2]|nr:MAG: hypothetical protein METHP_00755 [Methanoregula sp. SKADARSKE-2]